MAILLEVTVNAGKGQAPGSGAPRGGAQTVPRHTFRIAFDATGDWRLQAPMTPHWRSLFGEAMGKWKKDMAGTWICMDSKRQKTLLEIRRIDNLKGEVFFWPRAGNYGAVLYDGSGTWKPSDAPQAKTWVGVAVKGGAGAGVSGEAAFGAVMQLWGKNDGGCSFMTTTGRLGAVAGFSGGLALVYATGFPSAREFHGFASSGADFALAFGPKIAGAVSPAWAKVAKTAQGFDGGAELVEGIVKGGNPKYATLRSELPGIAKSISSAALIDPDEQNITIIDVPMAGAGAELGVFYGWSNTRLLSSW